MAQGHLTPLQTIKLRALIEQYANACADQRRYGNNKNCPFDEAATIAHNYLDSAKNLDAYLSDLTDPTKGDAT